jgi:hypothetical protein
MPTRGVLYLKWGDRADAVVQRSVASVQRFHPELDVKIIELDGDATLLDKSLMFDLSPFDETLFLDADTVVMGRLDFGFEKSVKHGIACCICECPWARRFGGLSGDIVEYNTGVLFFTRQAKAIFEGWKHHSNAIDSSLTFRIDQTRRGVMPCNDQAGFAKAVDDLGIIPFILPMNWNLRPKWQSSFFGPVKIWHDYDEPPAGFDAWNEQQGIEQKHIEFTSID